jgi:hypothetical protein
MQYTPELNLKKPQYTDPSDIVDLNDNATTIDGAIASLRKPSIVEVTTSKTLGLTDASTVQNSTSATSVTITIPTDAAVAFPVQTQIAFLREGAGTVTFAGAGVTINAEGAKRSISAQYGACCLVKTATNTWSLTGALTT